MFLQENNLRDVVFVCLGQHYTKTITCTRQTMFAHSPQSSQCFPNTAETTLHKKITGAMLAQSAQIYFRRKTGCLRYVRWPVFKPGTTSSNNHGSFCSMLAR